MAKAKCTKCGGWAIADLYEDAKKLINHAVGLTRHIKCGDSYNKVVEIIDKDASKIVKTIEKDVHKVAKTFEKPKTVKTTTKQTTKKSKDTDSSKTNTISTTNY